MSGMTRCNDWNVSLLSLAFIVRHASPERLIRHSRRPARSLAHCSSFYLLFCKVSLLLLIACIMTHQQNESLQHHGVFVVWWRQQRHGKGKRRTCTRNDCSIHCCETAVYWCEWFDAVGTLILSVSLGCATPKQSPRAPGEGVVVLLIQQNKRPVPQ